MIHKLRTFFILKKNFNDVSKKNLPISITTTEKTFSQLVFALTFPNPTI